MRDTKKKEGIYIRAINENNKYGIKINKRSKKKNLLINKHSIYSLILFFCLKKNRKLVDCYFFCKKIIH